MPAFCCQDPPWQEQESVSGKGTAYELKKIVSRTFGINKQVPVNFELGCLVPHGSFPASTYRPWAAQSNMTCQLAKVA